MRRWLCPFLCFLAACDTPGPGFHGLAPTRVTVGPSVFDVRVQGVRAEAIRVNSEWAPRLAAVAPRGLAAIEAVSGCRVRRLEGDQARMTARLDCGGPLAPLPRVRRLDCDAHVITEGIAELDCRPDL